MTVTKQQQLEWLANKITKWPDDRTIGYMMSRDEVGFVVGLFTRVSSYDPLTGYFHVITREEWQQERDKMSSKPEVDNSWHERREFPPAGCECDFCNSDDEWGDWQKSAFVGFDSAGNGVVSVFGDDKGLLWLTNNPSDFRPLRTEREKAIDVLIDIICASANA